MCPLFSGTTRLYHLSALCVLNPPRGHPAILLRYTGPLSPQEPQFPGVLPSRGPYREGPLLEGPRRWPQWPAITAAGVRPAEGEGGLVPRRPPRGGNSRPHWPHRRACRDSCANGSGLGGRALAGGGRAQRRPGGIENGGRARLGGARPRARAGDGGGAAVHPHQPQQLPRQAVAAGEQPSVPLHPLGRPRRGPAH